MASDLTVYSFAKVKCVIAGFPIEGFYDGDDVIKITRNDDSVTPLVGADGCAVVSISADLSGTIELKLKHNSLANVFLSRLEKRFRLAARAIPVPILISDLQTGDSIASAQVVVSARPNDTQYGKNASARTWKLFAAELDEIVIGAV